MTTAYPGASKVKITGDLVAKITVGRPKAYYSRAGTQLLAPDTREVTVTFATPLKDTSWIFGALTVWNVADALVDIVAITAIGTSNKSQSGFTVLLSQAPPNGNYRLDWSIAEAFNP